MSIGQAIANLFGGGQAPVQQAQPQQPQQAQPTPPGNIPPNQNPSQVSDPNNINAPAQTTDSQNKTGLDAFNDIWKPAESPAGGAPTDFLNVDPKQLMEAAQKVDFSKVINPASLQAISAGGEDAMKAFAQAMNQVAQATYAQSTMATAKIVQQAVAKTKESLMADLPQHIKLQTMNDTLRTDNPSLNHPAAAPILGALQQQLTVKYPNASAPELAKMAQDYLTNFAQLALPASKTQQPQTQANNEPDWDAYLN